jgi:hypothetical protein
VGGVAVIGLVIVALILIFRKKRSRPEAQSHPPPFVQAPLGGASDQNQYTPQPEKSAAAFQTTYDQSTSPMYSSPPTSPPQHYPTQPGSTQQQWSPAPIASSLQPQYFPAQHTGGAVSMDYTSNPTSSRPESQISQTPMASYAPYHTPVLEERHEAP